MAVAAAPFGWKQTHQTHLQPLELALALIGNQNLGIPLWKITLLALPSFRALHYVYTIAILLCYYNEL